MAASDATLREYREAAEGIQALSPEEQICRPFRIRAPEMLELLGEVDRLRALERRVFEFVAMGREITVEAFTDLAAA